VTRPGVWEVKVIVHEPVPFVFAPAAVHVPVGAVWTAPFESVNVTSTCSPVAGTNVPVPVSFSSVTVNVCETPISFVADGAIEIRAFSQVLFAFALSPACASPVARVSETPPTVTVVAALTAVVPVVVEVICTVHEPLPFVVVQVFTPLTKLPGPLTLVNVIVVPVGAFTKPAPSPALIFTWPVRV